MKTIKKRVFPIFVVASLFVVVGCDEDKILFPEQAQEDPKESISRGPVKQSDFKVITDADEIVKFDISNVDLERVSAVLFSHNSDGEKVETEVTDFESLYTIKNLPLKVVTTVEVWAKGLNNLESKKAEYRVTPKPYPARGVVDNTSLVGGALSGKIKIINTTGYKVVLYYKIDDELNYQSEEIDAVNYDAEVSLGVLSRGKHKVTYYFTDATGGKSDVILQEIDVYEGVEIDKSKLEVEASSTESNEGARNGQGFSMIDGDVETYWHSTWSSSSNPVYPHWFTVDLGEERLFEGIEMIRRHNNTGGGFKTFNIEYSVDGKKWVLIQKDLYFNSTSTPAAWQRYSVEPIKARYVRVTMVEASGSATSTHLAEINVFEAKY